MASINEIRYVDKLRLVGGVDPYKIDVEDMSKDPLQLPLIEYGDIYNDLINTSSAYTGQSLKAYKSLDSYNYFISGKVSDILTFVPPTSSSSALKFVVTAKVCTNVFLIMIQWLSVCQRKLTS